MEQFQIFQVEKNNEDIRKTVLTNVVKMLTERGILKLENQENNIKTLIDKPTDDNIYIITKDKYKEKEKQKIAVKLFMTKIASISKQSPISDFMNKHAAYHKIIIVKSINVKSAQHITSTFSETELFLEHDLMVNLVDCTFVPKYEVIDKDTDDFKNFCEIYLCKKRNIPKLFINDPMAKYYNLKKGDIVRIIRPSETSGYSSSYRIVVN
ncbi:DNA-directed RNA polymerase subunit 5 [Indivirus ILV1]|uniref:DNA-directed RNA polymerase subunit 5 n=1 Tax=Indivirus ILV1 TaxID=1977633 RepID=A0A1V0SCV3_9VIRU|nr:DNA-directed RNA polymerase subunit 5 [Indivirus ILV1]